MTPMEAAAKAAYEQYLTHGDWPTPWNELEESSRQEWRDFAYAVVRAYTTELSALGNDSNK